MAEKNLEALIIKVIKRAIKKELQKLEQEMLPSVVTQNNQPIEVILENFSNWKDENTTEKLIDDINIKQTLNLPSKEDLELERKLKELKFRQELRKDWILFIVRDVVLFPSTVVFIFVIAAYFVFVLFNKL